MLYFLCESIPADLKGKIREINVKGRCIRFTRITTENGRNCWFIECDSI